MKLRQKATYNHQRHAVYRHQLPVPTSGKSYLRPKLIAAVVVMCLAVTSAVYALPVSQKVSVNRRTTTSVKPASKPVAPPASTTPVPPKSAPSPQPRPATPATVPAPSPRTACSDNNLSQLVLVSLSQQHLWGCSGSSVAYETAVTTGAYQIAGDATPTGTWHIQSKQTDTYLTGPGYRYFVHYWIVFYSDYGFHDSSWQTFPYGGAEYATQGSHGCVHLPAAAATWLYNWAPVGTTVTIQS